MPPPNRIRPLGVLMPPENPDMVVKRNTVLIFRATSASLDFVADPYEVPFALPPSNPDRALALGERRPWAPVYYVHGLRLRFFNGDDDNRVVMNYRTPGSEVLGAKVFDVAFAALTERVPITSVWVWRPGEPWAIRALRPTNAELFVYAERTDRVD